MKRKSVSTPSSTPRKRRRSQSLESEDDITLRQDQPTPTPNRRKGSKSSLRHLNLEIDNVSHGEVESLTDRDDDFDELSIRGAEAAEPILDSPDEEDQVETPTKKKRGRPKGSKNVPKANAFTPTKSRLSQVFSTPAKLGKDDESETPATRKSINRSARRKSARAIIEHTIDGDLSDVEEDDDEISRHIFDSDDVDEDLAPAGDEESDQAEDHSIQVPDTPSKRGRGRPKKSAASKSVISRRRSPTPPPDLPPHEVYFAQNKSSLLKSSNNTLSSLSLLSHEEYFTLMRKYVDSHAQDMAFLQHLHFRSFSQWAFELEQKFSILLYGFGSKRTLLASFAKYLYNLPTFPGDTHKIVIINGYLPNTSMRDILTTVSRAITTQPRRLGAQPAAMLETVLLLLAENPHMQITLLVNSIDAASLRRPGHQIVLARLAEQHQIHFVATADHPNFPLLWDSSLRSMYNFVFHDCTTFRSYSAEIDVVDEVHALLGRSGRRIGGKEGVAFVLKSLSQRSRELFGVLVSEQLVGMEDGIEPGQPVDDEGQDNDDLEEPERKKGVIKHKSEIGVEYNVLLQKVMTEFICPDEMMFRTLLKEFYDHQMITSKKDALGTEILTVPFRKEELEAILEDLMS